MGLNDFTVKEFRPLPLFILADVSGSMKGEKINVLNLSIKEMISSLSNVDDIRGRFQICIITFGEEVKVHQPLSDVDKVSFTELTASGNTAMGQAFVLAKSIIEDRTQVPSRAFAPTVVLVSDGLPDRDGLPKYELQPTITTKEYLDWEPLKQFHNSTRSSKCLRLAMGIGDDVDDNMLKAFINNDEIPVIRSRDAGGIAKFFKWVTMSTVNRMNSADPNSPLTMFPFGFEKDENDEIIF